MGFRGHAKIVVVGAGLAGIAAAVKLRDAGFDDFMVLEKADRPGGVWRDNTYPGCGVDIPSPVYSFSFRPNPQWTSVFATQPQLLAYIEDTVAEYGLDSYISYGVEMFEAAWSDDERRWVLDTSAGRVVAQHVVFATGPLTEPVYPDVPGLASFAGEKFHSARWDHDVDLRGKRVAVIGTGASAVQFIPEIQPDVAQLHVFQRTPSWVVPRPNLPLIAPVRQVFGFAPVSQRLFRTGLDGVLRSITNALRHERLARLLNPVGHLWLAAQVRDPKLRRALTPDFTLGCKRLLLSNTYYPALTKPNVELLPQALRAVEPNAVVAADGTRREVDVLIFGTGFQVAESPVARRIRLRSGRLLSEVWAGSPRAYLATSVPDAPNAWILLGPNILVYNSFVALAEWQLNYIVDGIRAADAVGADYVEIDRGVVEKFNDDVQKALQPTVFNNGGCASYYLDSEGFNVAAWPWSTAELHRRLSRFDISKYHVRRDARLRPARATAAR